MSCAAPERRSVHLYCATTDSLEESALRDLVTDEDRAVLSPSAHPRRRAQHLAGRALLRFALQDRTRRPAQSHRFSIAQGGKPECIGGPAINLAHGDGLMVCAVSPAGRVGVDVQFPAPGRRVREIAALHFAPHEAAWVAAGPAARFYMLWVLKEAYLKAVGVGIGGGLDALSCRIEPPLIEAAVAKPVDLPELALYSAGDAFVAVAVLGYRFADVTITRWRPSLGTLAPAPFTLVARTC